MDDERVIESLARIERLLTNRIPRLPLYNQMIDTVLPSKDVQGFCRLRTQIHEDGIRFEIVYGNDLIWRHDISWWGYDVQQGR